MPRITSDTVTAGTKNRGALLRDEVMLGGGIDALHMPTKFTPGMHELVQNYYLDQLGGYTSRAMNVCFNITATPANDPIMIGTDYCRITQLIDYQMNHNATRKIIAIGDNFGAAADYKVAVFWIELDTDGVSYKQYNNLIDPGGDYGFGTHVSQAYFTGNPAAGIKYGMSRDLYWDWCVVTDPQTLHDILILTNGSTVPLVYDPSTGTYLRTLGYQSGTCDDWKIPSFTPTFTPVTNGYLYGKYFYKFLWVDEAGTQHRSPPTAGLPTNGVMLQNEWMDISNLPSAGGDWIEVYRTKGDGGTFFYCGATESSTFNDRVADRDLKWKMPAPGDPPEKGFRFCAFHGNRLWLFNRRVVSAGTLSSGIESNRLVWSDLGYVEQFQGDYSDIRAVHETNTNKRDPGTGLYSTGDVLMVFTEDSTWRGQGWAPNNYGGFDFSCLHRRIGCSSHRTLAEDEKGNLLWMWNKQLCGYNKYDVRQLAPYTEGYLGHVKQTKKSMMCAAYDAKRRHYILGYPKDQTDYNDKTICIYPALDYQFIEMKGFNAGTFAEIENVNNTGMEKIWFGTGLTGSSFGGYIYKTDQLTSDYKDLIKYGTSVTIDKDWKTDWRHQGYPELLKMYVKCVAVIDMIDDASAYIDFEAYVDGMETTPVCTDQLYIDKTDRDYGIIPFDLYDSRVSGGKPHRKLKGHMIKCRLRNNRGNSPFRLIQFIIYYAGGSFVQRPMYQIAEP